MSVPATPGEADPRTHHRMPGSNWVLVFAFLLALALGPIAISLGFVGGIVVSVVIAIALIANVRSGRQ